MERTSASRACVSGNSKWFSGERSRIFISSKKWAMRSMAGRLPISTMRPVNSVCLCKSSIKNSLDRAGELSKTWNRVVSEKTRSEEHTSELQSRGHLVCRLLLEKKKKYRVH